MGEHRTVTVRIEALKEQLRNMELKQALNAHSDNPEVKKIDARLKQLKSDELKYRGWKAKAAPAVIQFQNRASLWQSRGDNADKALAQLTKDRESLTIQRANIIAKGV